MTKFARGLDARALSLLDCAPCSRGQANGFSMPDSVLAELASIIHQRRQQASDTSYTRQLLDGGPQRCAKKLGEEAIETVIAGVSEDDQALRAEAADLLYHLLVLLEARGVAIDDVLDILQQRMGTSGLEEKASRK